MKMKRTSTETVPIISSKTTYSSIESDGDVNQGSLHSGHLGILCDSCDTLNTLSDDSITSGSNIVLWDIETKQHNMCTRSVTADLCRRVCQIVCILSLCWSLAYIIWGFGPKGKSFYSVLAGHVVKDVKAGVPTITLTLPLLLAVCFSTLFFLPRSTSTTPLASVAGYKQTRKRRSCCSVTRWLTIGQDGGDWDFDRFSFVFLALPVTSCLFLTISRHLLTANTFDQQVMGIGNSCATAAVIALSFWMIPVTKHSIILSVFGWSPIHATKIHIWAGRLTMFGLVIHGICHMYRWILLQESVLGMIIPPPSCWTWNSLGDESYVPSERACYDEEADCNCLALFRNMTGVIGALTLIILTISSLSWVRRKHYRIFYICHMTAAPLFLVMSIVHWVRTLLYILPGILYYAAATCPLTIQAISNYWYGGVKLIKAAPIPECEGEVTELCFEASTDAISTLANAPAQYARICVPKISAIWHPFTVFTTPLDKKTTVRMIIRGTGPFTKALARHASNTYTPFPTILMDGFHSGPDRIAQALRHDSVIMIAGGIGITPYLSFLPMLYAVLNDKHVLGLRTRKISLHWMCRDEGLIQHVITNYLSFVVDEASQNMGLELRIVVHHTGDGSTMEFKYDSDEVELPKIKSNLFAIDEDEHDVEDQCLDNDPFDESNHDSGIIAVGNQKGLLVTPSLFTPGPHLTVSQNLPAFFMIATTMWTSLSVVWVTSHTIVAPSVIWFRLFPLVALIVVSFVVSIFAVVCTKGCMQSSIDGIRVKMEANLGKHKTNGGNFVSVMPLADYEEEEDKFAQSADSEVGYRQILHHQSGRPSIESIIAHAHDAENPGIFVCGPKPITNEIRRISSARKCALCQRSTRIAVYEEAFAP